MLGFLDHFKMPCKAIYAFPHSVLFSGLLSSVFASCGVCRDDACVTSKCDINSSGRSSPPSTSWPHIEAWKRTQLTAITSGIFQQVQMLIWQKGFFFFVCSTHDMLCQFPFPYDWIHTPVLHILFQQNQRKPFWCSGPQSHCHCLCAVRRRSRGVWDLSWRQSWRGCRWDSYRSCCWWQAMSLGMRLQGGGRSHHSPTGSRGCRATRGCKTRS